MSKPPFSDIAIAQVNPVVGDIAGNVQKLREARKAAGGAALVVAPELAITGYPPEDLLLTPEFVHQAMQALFDLAQETADGGPALLVGCPWQQEHCYNVAALLDEGKIKAIRAKSVLPNYGVFDEHRYFHPCEEPLPISFRGRNIGVIVCEDMWHAEPATTLKARGAEWLIVLNASPFERGKQAARREAARAHKLPVLYVNTVGGQDDIVFDGASFALDAEGEVLMHAPAFVEGIFPASHGVKMPLPEEEQVWDALVLGTRDYVQKNGFSKVLLGLSGGIDSAVVAAVAVDALGKENVRGVMLPSPFNSKESAEDAHETTKLLGIGLDDVPILPAMQAYTQMLSGHVGGGWMEELAVGGNLQARLRGVTLMALSNQTGALLLNTSNKSEIAVGYSTLYGDSCGAYGPLKDVYKTEVYALAEWRNGKSIAIPERSISKAPTAELKPGQLDQDQLPPYEVLDDVLRELLEHRKAVNEVTAAPRELVQKIWHMLRLSEYKRRQFCPGPKISPMLFGRDRRFPVTNRWVQVS